MAELSTTFTLSKTASYAPSRSEPNRWGAQFSPDSSPLTVQDFGPTVDVPYFLLFLFLRSDTRGPILVGQNDLVEQARSNLRVLATPTNMSTLTMNITQYQTVAEAGVSIAHLAPTLSESAWIEYAEDLSGLANGTECEVVLESGVSGTTFQNFYLGSKEISRVYLGSKEITRGYLGARQVFGV